MFEAYVQIIYFVLSLALQPYIDILDEISASRFQPAHVHSTTPEQERERERQREREIQRHRERDREERERER